MEEIKWNFEIQNKTQLRYDELMAPLAAPFSVFFLPEHGTNGTENKLQTMRLVNTLKIYDFQINTKAQTAKTTGYMKNEMLMDKNVYVK